MSNVSSECPHCPDRGSTSSPVNACHVTVLIVLAEKITKTLKAKHAGSTYQNNILRKETRY